MYLRILNAQMKSILCSFLSCAYYYVDVVPAVVNEIQDEDGLDYTEEITKTKEGKIVIK